MSKRAKEKAWKAYPKRPEQRYITAFGTFEFDYDAPNREGFIKGYEQAEKDTVERAIAWLKVRANDYIVDLTPTYPDAPVNIIVGGKCWDDLKEYLEEEK